MRMACFLAMTCTRLQSLTAGKALRGVLALARIPRTALTDP